MEEKKMKGTALLMNALLAMGVCLLSVPGMRTASALPDLEKFQEPISPVTPGTTLRSLSLSKTSVVGGATFTGTVSLQFLAPNSGASVSLRLTPGSILQEDLESPKVQLPSSVRVPAGKSSAIFTIATFAVSSDRQITIEARAGGVTRTASFTIHPLELRSLVIVPSAGFGPFEAQGTVALNLQVPSDTTVSLTSSNLAVRFGHFGAATTSASVIFHPNDPALKSFSIVASPVPQTTSVTVSATLNGRTVSQSVTIRH
jgi:hypothetical protein